MPLVSHSNVVHLVEIGWLYARRSLQLQSVQWYSSLQLHRCAPSFAVGDGHWLSNRQDVEHKNMPALHGDNASAYII
jgi:hypothetical protein